MATDYYQEVLGTISRAYFVSVSRNREKYLKWDQILQKKSMKNTKSYTLFFVFLTVKAIARIYVQNCKEKHWVVLKK